MVPIDQRVWWIDKLVLPFRSLELASGDDNLAVLLSDVSYRRHAGAGDAKERENSHQVMAVRPGRELQASTAKQDHRSG